jgi:hypothetical protein
MNKSSAKDSAAEAVDAAKDATSSSDTTKK